jgi:hypothetical protein
MQSRTQWAVRAQTSSGAASLTEKRYTLVFPVFFFTFADCTFVDSTLTAVALIYACQGVRQNHDRSHMPPRRSERGQGRLQELPQWPHFM